MHALLLSFAAALAASTAVAAPAPAAAPKHTALESDVRCIIVMAALTQDKQRQQAGVIGAHFFAGRVSARAPGVNLTEAIRAEEAKMRRDELPAELQRCGPIVQAAVQALQASFQAPASGPPGGPAAAAPSAAAPPSALTPPAPK